MKVKDLMDIFICHDEMFKIFYYIGADILSREEIITRDELMMSEIDYCFRSPLLNCICIMLKN